MANGLFGRPSPATGARTPSEILELYGRSPERGMGDAARRSAGPNSGTIADLLERVQGQGSPQQMPGSPPTVDTRLPPQQGSTRNPRQRMAQDGPGLDINNLIDRINRMGKGNDPMRDDPRMVQARRDTDNRLPQDITRDRSLGSPQQQPEGPQRQQEDRVAYEGPIESLPNETELTDRDILADIVSRPGRHPGGQEGRTEGEQQSTEEQPTQNRSVDTRLPPGMSREDLQGQGEGGGGILDALMNDQDTGRTLLDLGTSLMATESPHFAQALGQAGQQTLEGMDEREARELEARAAEAQIEESKARTKQMGRANQEITQDAEGRFVRIDQDGNAEFVTMSGIPIKGATKQSGLTGYEKLVADFYTRKLENKPLDQSQQKEDQKYLIDAMTEAAAVLQGTRQPDAAGTAE